MGKVMVKNLDELRREVRACGLRATPSRLAVLELLRASDAPMSHGDVADRFSSPSSRQHQVEVHVRGLCDACY